MRFIALKLWVKLSEKILSGSGHRKTHQRVVNRKHREERAAFDGIVLAVLGPRIGMMEIPGSERLLPDMQVACQNVKILRPGIGVGGITHSGLEFAKQN